MDRWSHMARCVKAICWKDIKVYYVKGPVIIMGVLFPLFLWLAFQVGKGLNLRQGITPLIAITVFFTSSAVTPTILPWETRQKTLEMLLSRPITITFILAGDMAAATMFGLGLTILPVIYGLALGAAPSSPALLIGFLALSSLEYSALGVLFSAMPTNLPADVIMISNAVKLPLIFLSGVFTPLSSLPSMLRYAALLSPLTYTSDFVRGIYGGQSYFPCTADIALTILYTFILIIISVKLHGVTAYKRLQLK